MKFKLLLISITLILIIGCAKTINEVDEIKLPKTIDELGLVLSSYTYSNNIGGHFLNQYPGLENGEKIEYHYTDKEGTLIKATALIIKFDNIELGQKKVIEKDVYTGGQVIPTTRYEDDYTSTEEIITGKKVLKFKNKDENIVYKIFPTYVWNDGKLIYIVRIENERDINVFLSKIGLIK